MTVSLHRLGLQDMARVAVVLRQAFDERLPWLAGIHTPQEDRLFFENHVYASCEVWGALDADIVGFIAFREGWVDQLYVLPGYQNRGIGAVLLGAAKATWPTLQLWTFQKNMAARHFYEKHGFTAIRETDGRDNEEREPDILYLWQPQARLES
ncbi:MAG: GNAT family N-acetyltransferase [Aquamicrobium sp.]|uniref:GNAT family N-acetyltransferase n=1 Tax=Mesorhizobium sp. Pch-S TaxID=2082387 RepID=UPI001012B592|nr:GNAT family N-acetyltransferase [Mesorhizobium sp. Pch-S]MBR2692404.1 GNAT family N-acetyltransferase [Aquamicrobium sp.]QAZ46239.1 GNAT family N-acetyltransferase [Mesorhizobium sp. Pch-S]